MPLLSMLTFILLVEEVAILCSIPGSKCNNPVLRHEG